MTITHRRANRHTVVATGWTAPTNAYALVGDNSYATIVSAKNSTLSGDFGFPDITTGDAEVDTPGSPWTSNTQGSTQFFGVAYGNGYWVAVGDSGTLYYRASDPAGAWTSNTQGSLRFRSVAYGNGYWVAVGTSGNLYYKATDPTGAWTSNTQGSTERFGIAHDGSYWAAVGGSVNAIRATDPTGSWTSQSIAQNLRGVAYGNGYWVAVGDSGTLYYRASDPAGAWTSNTQGSTGFNGVAYGNGYWVAVGTSGNLYYKATDPTGAWTSHTQGSTTFQAVAYGNGYWVAVGTSGNLYYNATDPTGAWTSNTQGSTGFNGVAYGNGYWVAVGSTGALRYLYVVAPGIPDGSTINSVKVKVEWGMTASVTGGELGLQPRRNNADAGSETVKTTTTEEAGEATYTGVTLSDLRSAETSDLVEARIRVTKGSTNTAMTGNLDYCFLEVDFTAPAGAGAFPFPRGDRKHLPSRDFDRWSMSGWR